MTPAEVQMITNRLDAIDGKLDTVVEKVTTQAAVCPPTRKRVDEVCETVYGEGGIVSRTTALETVSRMRSKGFWVMVGLVSAIASGAVIAAIKAIPLLVSG